MPLENIAAWLPESIAAEVKRSGPSLTELRMRIGKPAQLVDCEGKDRFVGEDISAALLRKITVQMMDYSYYAREDELARGYFTLKNGCRVGVCGAFSEPEEGRFRLRAIGSICIRSAFEIRGCATQIASEIESKGFLGSALILSPPGMGKTTMLRDLARQLSERGYQTGIADERHEIAACLDGVPTMDVGPRTDVIDGCLKAQAIGMMIRSMSPKIIIADEIGSVDDESAVREAARMGVAIITSAHASSIDSFEKSRLGRVLGEGLFPIVILLGDKPGNVKEIRRYGNELCL